jgi:hypothetical protein
MTSSHQLARDIVESAGLFQAKVHVEQAAHHDDQVAQNLGQAQSFKSQGDKALAGLHADAATHHGALSVIHTDIAQKHLKQAKTQNLGESFGRGYRRAEDLVDFSAYDMRKSPSSRGEMDNPRPAHSVATVKDMMDVANKVAARHQARLELIRVLGDEGFVCGFVVGGGMFVGTTQPSVSDVEQELVRELRAVAPAAKVDLITADEISGSGPTARRLVFRFRLGDRGRTQS